MQFVQFVVVQCAVCGYKDGLQFSETRVTPLMRQLLGLGARYPCGVRMLQVVKMRMAALNNGGHTLDAPTAGAGGTIALR